MGAVGGDVVEINFNHQTVGQFTVFAKASEDNTLDPGGYRKVDDDDMVDGSGEVITTMNNKRWSIEVVVVNDMNTREDLDKMAQVSASPLDADITLSLSNGTVWGGSGSPVGDLKANINQATFPCKIAGGNGLEKIAG